MESLYDVFSAIRDDEGDHVSTMEACLDPNVAKLSPSLEKKFLTGIAAAAAVAVFLNTGADIGIGGDELSGVADGVDLATDSGSFGAAVDAAVAGLAGVTSQFGNKAEEGAEEGISYYLAQVASEIVDILSKLL